MESQLKREMAKIKRNLDGIRHMDKLPGCMVVIDTKREKNALLEAQKLGIPTICLVDTDGDPDMVDIPIPGNDDSMRAIDVVIRELCAAVADGKQQRMTATGEKEGAEGGAGRDGGRGGDSGGARRSRRTQFRADDAGNTAEAEAIAAGGKPSA
jgi:small subunit ribosomal protein S2